MQSPSALDSDGRISSDARQCTEYKKLRWGLDAIQGDVKSRRGYYEPSTQDAGNQTHGSEARRSLLCMCEEPAFTMVLSLIRISRILNDPLKINGSVELAWLSLVCLKVVLINVTIELPEKFLEKGIVGGKEIISSVVVHHRVQADLEGVNHEGVWVEVVQEGGGFVTGKTLTAWRIESHEVVW